MENTDGKQFLENKVRMDVEKIMKDSPSPEPPKQPVGTVERVLNFQDRSLLLFGCKLYCKDPSKGDYRSQSRLTKLDKLLVHDETVEYFEMIDDSLEDRLFKWQRERNDWLLVQQYLAGGISLEEVKKKSPALDVDDPPKKPSRVQPEADPEEVRGKERSFYLPSKLDSWVQDVLKEVKWPNPEKAKYITELCTKFGIKGDED